MPASLDCEIVRGSFTLFRLSGGYLPTSCHGMAGRSGAADFTLTHYRLS